MTSKQKEEKSLIVCLEVIENSLEGQLLQLLKAGNDNTKAELQWKLVLVVFM